MSDEENFYKREEDRKWRENVDSRLVTLITAQTVVNDRLDELEEISEALDRVLRGDPEKDTGGLIERLHDAETSTSRLSALLFPDHTGNGGLVNDVKTLKRRDELEQRNHDNRWKFWTAIALAIISSATLLIKEWPKIWDNIMNTESKDPVRKAINRAKNPRPIHRHYKVIIPQTTPETGDYPALTPEESRNPQN